MPESNPMLYVLLGVLIGWFCTLSSGALIGFMIFRTKKESHEPLFRMREPKGEAFNIEEDWEKEFPPPQESPEKVTEHAKKFREQFAKEKPDIVDRLGKEEVKE